MHLSLSLEGRRQGGVICELGYTVLRKSHRIVWWATVHGVAQSQLLQRLSTQPCTRKRLMNIFLALRPCEVTSKK